MARIETWFEQDLKRAVKVRYIDGNVFSQDSNGNLVGVRVFDGGTPATLSGSVSASVVRADGSTVAVAGSLSGNSCYVVLPQAAYAFPGVLSIVIKLTSGGSTTTLCAVVSNVYQSATDTVVDPGTIIPSVQALITEIENTRATIPADYTEFYRSFDAKFPINDAVLPAFISAYYPFDTTGTTTTGKAWRAEKGEVTGSQYAYTTYQVPSGYAGNVAIIYGHGWGKPYPLVCFYDSNMNFIMSAGWRGDTDYKGLPIIIPPATATIVINHRSASAFRTGIVFYSINDAIPLLKKIGTYGRMIDINTILTQFPEYKDVRNLPTNCVYAIAHDAYTQMINIPPGLNTYATILKVNGAYGGQLASVAPYNTYFCVNENAFWVGFETNDALYWRLVSGGATVSKKYLFIGDSYGDGYSHDGNNSGWCEYLAEKMGLSSSQYEARHQGGSGFSNGGFLARLNSATGTGFTDIVVLGGFNDYNSTVAAIENGISAFCARALALFPHATVHIGCVGWIKAGTGESAYQNWQEVRDKITGTVLPTYQNCNKYGAQYIAFSEYLLNDSLMTPTDGYHPGEAGNRAIAAGVVNALATGVACMPFKSVLKG